MDESYHRRHGLRPVLLITKKKRLPMPGNLFTGIFEFVLLASDFHLTVSGDYHLHLVTAAVPAYRCNLPTEYSFPPGDARLLSCATCGDTNACLISATTGIHQTNGLIDWRRWGATARGNATGRTAVTRSGHLHHRLVHNDWSLIRRCDFHWGDILRHRRLYWLLWHRRWWN